MRKITRMGFQPMNPFLQGDMVLGSTRLRLGVVVDKATRDQLLSKIKTGTTKLAAVRAWIETKIGADPGLALTFGQEHVASNFWGYMDLINRSQWAVDQAQAVLQGANGWSLGEEEMLRTNDWVSAVDIVYDAVKQYGAVDPITLLPSPEPSPEPSSGIQTPPPSSGPSTATVLTIGAVAVAVVGIVTAFLWPRS